MPELLLLPSTKDEPPTTLEAWSATASESVLLRGRESTRGDFLDGEGVQVVTDPASFAGITGKGVQVVFPETVIFPRSSEGRNAGLALGKRPR